MTMSNPFEAATRMLLASAEKFTPEAAQDASRLLLEHLHVWGDLAQGQAQAVQSAAREAVAEFQAIKEPAAAVETFKRNARKAVTLSAKHLKEATELGVEQFNAGVDLLQERHPAPDSFAPVAQGMKTAASAIEGAVLSTLMSGASEAEPAPKAAPRKKRT